jgi:hypothetical protein
MLLLAAQQQDLQLTQQQEPQQQHLGLLQQLQDRQQLHHKAQLNDENHQLRNTSSRSMVSSSSTSNRDCSKHSRPNLQVTSSLCCQAQQHSLRRDFTRLWA